MAATSDIARLRARLAPHGYHVFLQPERPTGWLAILQGGTSLRDPISASAPNRATALATAESLFVQHRLGELDSAIRAAGLTPPVWNGTHDDQLDALHAFAAEHRVAA